VRVSRRNATEHLAANSANYCGGHSGGQVGIGRSAVTLCLVGKALTAKTPAAASASQSEIVSFFMLILLRFVKFVEQDPQPRN